MLLLTPNSRPREKALIYHYTATGSTPINRLLHANSGEQPAILAQQLMAAVQKMPTYEGSAYSAAHLSPALLGSLYVTSLIGDTVLTAGKIKWPAFLSASRSMRIARRHMDYTNPPTPHNCLFVLNSLQGRSIELLSQYGPNGRDPLDGEQEIIFLPNTTFRIIGADFATPHPLIELFEV